MLSYRKGSEVDFGLVYEAFTIGFSDYIIKLEISRELFEKNFFGPEGNSLGHSFIAMDENKPVGIVLGGIKVYEGIKTMRCGTMAVHPDYRRQGIGEKLMALHKEEGVRQGCKRLFLEVIVGNDRAVDMYKKLQYEKVYDLEYFTLEDAGLLEKIQMETVSIRPAGIEDLHRVRQQIRDVHINWQNDIDYIEKIEEPVFYGAFDADRLVGLICLQKSGRVKFLWADADYRHRGIGTNLISKAISELGLTKVTISMPNNASLRGFVTCLGFKKDAISQYEMYHVLK